MIRDRFRGVRSQHTQLHHPGSPSRTARCIIKQQKIKHTTSIETSDAWQDSRFLHWRLLFNTLPTCFMQMQRWRTAVTTQLSFFAVGMWFKSIRRCHMSLSTLFPNYPEGRYNCLAVMSHRQLIRRLRYKHYSPDGRVEHQVRYSANPFCFNTSRNDN